MYATSWIWPWVEFWIARLVTEGKLMTHRGNRDAARYLLDTLLLSNISYRKLWLPLARRFVYRLSLSDLTHR